MSEVMLFEDTKMSEVLPDLKAASRFIGAISTEPRAITQAEVSGPGGFKVILPWSIVDDFLQDNPEGGAASTMIARMMRTQLANDVEDLLINGDTDLQEDQLLRAVDGLLKRVEVIDNDASTLHDQLSSLTSTIPNGADKTEYCLLVSADTELDYILWLGGQDGGKADEHLVAMASNVIHDRVALQMTPYLPSNTVVLLKPAEFEVALSDLVAGPQSMSKKEHKAYDWQDKGGKSHHVPAKEYVQHEVSAMFTGLITFEPTHAAAIHLNG